MKKILLSLTLIGLFVFSSRVTAQTILFDDFSSTPVGSVPSGWTVSSNTSVQNYQRPFPCTADKGLQTPGVGKNAPSRFILPTLHYDASVGIITVTFTVYVFDANLNCSSVKDFPCPTFVSAYLIKDTYAGGINSLPAGSDIFAQQSYQLVTANGSNTIIFNNPSIGNGAGFRVYLDFKTAASSNCTGQGTKFIFDLIDLSETTCTNNICPPVAQVDYFDASRQAFFTTNTIKANVLGGFVKWSSQLHDLHGSSEFDLKSLASGPTSLAVDDGLDYDNNNPDLSTMTFNKLTNPVVVTSICGSISAGSSAGTLIWNSDGSFTFTRSSTCIQRASFTYSITDGSITTAPATVYIDFVASIPLPVSFKSFTATRNHSNVSLRWETATEQNSSGFAIERNVSGTWEQIAFVPSQAPGGNSNSPLSYFYSDLNNVNGISQYRIRQVDFDAKSKYSDIKAVRGDGQMGKIIVYPNPSSSGRVNVVFEDATTLRDASLTDITGRMLKQWKGIVNNNIQIENLASGMYNLKIVVPATGAQTIEKIIVNKF